MQQKQKFVKPAFLNKIDAIIRAFVRICFWAFLIAIILSIVFYYTELLTALFYAQAVAVLSAFIYIAVGIIRRAMSEAFEVAVEERLKEGTVEAQHQQETVEETVEDELIPIYDMP